MKVIVGTQVKTQIAYNSKSSTFCDVKDQTAKVFKFEEQRELSEAFLIKEQKPTLNIQNPFKI